MFSKLKSFIPSQTGMHANFSAPTWRSYTITKSVNAIAPSAAIVLSRFNSIGAYSSGPHSGGSAGSRAICSAVSISTSRARQTIDLELARDSAS